MITHIALFRWKPDTTDEQLARIRAGLASLPAAITDISSYRFGPDLGANGAGNMDFGIVATFDSIDAWQRYDTHPEHDRVRVELIRPCIAERAALQFES